MSTQIGNVAGGGDRVTRAISASARATGVDFNYLLGQARVESGLNPNAKARTSSATGLFQFIDQSWLGVVEKHGSKYGLDWASAAINRDSRGRFGVADADMRQSILELRKNPEIASLMAGEFAADNQNYLERNLGRNMAPVDLYLAHFLGPEGARKFLSAHDANPDAPAAPQFAKAAGANRSIFYDRSGAPRSFAEIRARFADKLGDDSPLPRGRGLPDGGNAVPQVQPADYIRLASQRSGRDSTAPTTLNANARLAYLMLASLGA